VCRNKVRQPFQTDLFSHGSGFSRTRRESLAYKPGSFLHRVLVFQEWPNSRQRAARVSSLDSLET